MLNIDIKTIPHKKQKYETVGDYWEKNGKKSIRVSDMKNPKYELLIAIHELLEQALTADRGIAEKLINEFDHRFEAERELGQHTIDEEPGFDPYAPYLKEHAFATKVERMLAQELGVDWEKYNHIVNHL